MPEDRSPSDTALIGALVMMSRAMVALSIRSLAQVDADVTIQQYRTLVWLVSAPLRVSDLARLLGVQSSTMTRMCDRLIRKGLISRQGGTADRREAWISLTDEGIALVVRGMRHRQGEIEKVAAGLDPDGRAVEVIAAFAKAVGEIDQREWLRRAEERVSG